jgi:hypothetical protein
MVGMTGGGNRGDPTFLSIARKPLDWQCSQDIWLARHLCGNQPIQSARTIPYRLKNDDNVDPADAVSGLAGAAGGCAAGAGAGSSRFDERFEE